MVGGASGGWWVVPVVSRLADYCTYLAMESAGQGTNREAALATFQARTGGRTLANYCS